MGYVQARFGQGYNRRCRSSGPRWQSRYKARLIEDSFQYDRLIAYIHLNPVQAGVVDDPAEYVFSGHRELLGRIKHPLIDVDGVLALFGDTVRVARRAYVRAMKGAREEEWLGESRGLIPWWVHEVDRRVEPVAPTSWIDELGRSTGLERPRIDSREFLLRSCKLLDISIATLAGAGKGRELSRQRYLIAALGIERWGLTAKPLAELVGRLPEAVSRWASRGAELRQESEAFSDTYENLDQQLAAYQATGRSPQTEER